MPVRKFARLAALPVALVALGPAPDRAAGQDVVTVPGPRPAAFRIAPEAGAVLREIWAASVRAREERVACLAGERRGDTVHVTAALALEVADTDSLGMGAQESIDRCGPPAWRGTAHTHIAAQGGGRPYARFSSLDRTVMSLWRARWRVEGYFCVLYSRTDAHCEAWGGGAGPAAPAPPR